MKIKELIEQAKQGNKEAYAELFNLLYKDLYNLAFSKLHDYNDAQDAIQETFLTAYEHLSSLRHAKYFKIWLRIILRNKCCSIFKKRKNKCEPTEFFDDMENNEPPIDSTINFKSLIGCLNAKEQEVFKLRYEQNLKSSEISKILGINENSVKSILKRGKTKLSDKIKRSTLILILCLLITTGIIAVCAISYIKSLFALNSVGKDNRSVLMAIENSEWFQQTNMDYISIDDKNKIRLDYLLMDEMNLYMVFDFKTEDDISKFTDIGLLGLKIENESGDIICDNENVLSPQYRKSMGNKVIESTSNSMKFLVYLYTDNFPMSNTLNIHFSKITLAKKLSIKHSLYSDVSLDVSLDEKFTNRHSVYLHSDSKKIYKSIITETGFYCILDLEYGQTIKKAKLFDQNNNSYDCYFTQLTSTGSYSTLQYIIISNFNNKDANNLKLVIDNNEYFLTK